MLASSGPLPSGPGWSYEFKWDGVRLVAEIDEDDFRLYTRTGVDVTVAYPELAALAERAPGAVLDGEVVVLDEGRPSFDALAERMHVRENKRARRLAAARPVTFMIFDVLRLYGVDLCDRPYRERRATLDRLELDGDRWCVPPAFDDGPATLAASQEHGLEGVVAKRLDAPYRPGQRSPDWVKVKHVHTADLVVGGYRPGERPLGALLVGEPRPDGTLTYRGRVGGGLSDRMVTQLLALLDPLRQDGSPFADRLPRDDAHGAIWVTPQVVVEIEYGNQTSDGRLRFSRFRRLRQDVSPVEVGRERG